MCAIMKMGRPLLYQLPEQLPYHRDKKEWVSFITSQKMTVWCLFFLWYNIVALHHPGVRWRELLGSSWLRQGYLVQCIFQFLRLMGCPLKGTEAKEGALLNWLRLSVVRTRDRWEFDKVCCWNPGPCLHSLKSLRVTTASTKPAWKEPRTGKGYSLENQKAKWDKVAAIYHLRALSVLGIILITPRYPVL